MVDFFSVHKHRINETLKSGANLGVSRREPVTIAVILEEPLGPLCEGEVTNERACAVVYLKLVGNTATPDNDMSAALIDDWEERYRDYRYEDFFPEWLGG